MSEEILNALTQLFAIISKQDGGVSEKERNFVIKYFKSELDSKTVSTYLGLYDDYSGYGKEVKQDKNSKTSKTKMTNVRDSVRTLKLCRQINRTLNQKQKFFVLVKLLELISSGSSFTPQRMQIINTVSDVFNIPTVDYKILEAFVVSEDSTKLDHEDILVFDEQQPPKESKNKFIDSGLLDGEIIFLRAASVGLYFTKYTGNDAIYLNNQLVKKDSITQFSPGSVFKTPKGSPLYYSDLVSTYNHDAASHNISFNVNNLEYKFPNGTVGLRNVNLSEGSGSLIGIMGASGAGKTTLLNTLAGLEHPSKGAALINGYNIHTQKEKIEGVIGYVAQDDLLIEELSVYENLYFNAKLCFEDLSKKELNDKVNSVLESLGLEKIADLKVGNVFNKKISGGQRKRLNIALELIRQPSVMFVDEPTSGLSSRDSENVIDLLKELSLKGKLIFVVIHQPSSDIYKMFNKMLIMDTGGYPIFYGDPIEAIIYFKTASNQVDSEQGQCMSCGNVNPEQLFNIVEAKVVDEFGQFSNNRKHKPDEWHNTFVESFKLERLEDINEDPPKNLKIPSVFKQSWIFTVRDTLSKISDKQYMFINLTEAPFLALLLALIIRYVPVDVSDYVFSDNDNIPAYILICIIISLFMGLTVSAEEIIHDRKILRRESFLNLSRFSYLTSKIIILFGLSMIQTLSFVIIGNTILEVKGMTWDYWLVLFTISCHANVLGLNISSAFNSAVTVYILIPLLLIPQLILSGLIFDFDKLNNTVSTPGKTPFIADFMASRWGYEAIAVNQFKHNEYYKDLFPIELLKKQANFKSAYWIPEVEELLDESYIWMLDREYSDNKDSINALIQKNAEIVGSELLKNDFFAEHVDLNIEEHMMNYNQETITLLKSKLSEARNFYGAKFRAYSSQHDSLLRLKKKSLPEGVKISELKKQYHNKRLQDAVKYSTAENRILVSDGKIIQITEPIFNIPNDNTYRAHFYAPYKSFFGLSDTYIDTYKFNVGFVWFMTLLLFISLYYNLLAKLLNRISNLLPSND